MDWVTYGRGFDAVFKQITDVNKQHKKNNSFFHYTSLENCINILKKINDENSICELWASNLAFLNDSMEYNDGYSILKDSLKKREDDFRKSADEKELIQFYERIINNDSKDLVFKKNIYAICFCRDEDLLSQWKYYSNGGGIAIEFDLNKCAFLGNSVVNKDKTMECTNMSIDVVYEDKIKSSILDRRINDLLNVFSKNKDHKREYLKLEEDILLTFIGYFKDGNFKEEKESRMLFLPLFKTMEDKRDVKDLIKYRVRNGKIIPFLKIIVKNQDEQYLPIKSLRIGPCKNQQLIFQALSHFISKDLELENIQIEKDGSCVVNGIKIIKSKIPFRE